MNSDAVVIALPVSETLDPLLTKFGRLPDGIDGVRECRISNRVALETGWTSGIPFRNANVLTWTALPSAYPTHELGSSPVRGLSSNVLVQWIPRYSLNEMGMFSERIDAFAYH